MGSKNKNKGNHWVIIAGRPERRRIYKGEWEECRQATINNSAHGVKSYPPHEAESIWANYLRNESAHDKAMRLNRGPVPSNVWVQGRYPQTQRHGVSNISYAQRYRNEPSSGATVYANRQVYQRQQIQNYEALQRQEYFRAVAFLPGTSDQLRQKRSREPLERQEDHELVQEPPMKKQHYDITFDSDSEDEDITPLNTIQISLSAEQQAVIELARGGCNIFLTGAAGCGKTVTLTKLLDTLKAEKKKFRVIAPTAIAALPLKGTTMHSFFGWGLDPFEKTSHERVASFSPSTRKRIETVQVFIIEEISMLSSLLLDKMNEDLREIMANDCPFGGKQVIFTGDFNQLPPVLPFKTCSQCHSRLPHPLPRKGPFNCTNSICSAVYHDEDKWAFKARVWDDLQLRNIRLNTFHRQKDPKFQAILTKIRKGTLLDTDDWHSLRASTQHPDGIPAVSLYSKRQDADDKNEREFRVLTAQERAPKTWKAYDQYQEYAGRRELEKHVFNPELKLAVGAKVVLLVNLDQKAGLVNGSQGKVIGFERRDDSKPLSQRFDDEPHAVINCAIEGGTYSNAWAPVVLFENRRQQTIWPTALASQYFEQTKGCWYLASRTQMPLALAWGLTIHKSQGMTLNRVAVSSENIWERGQLYVALSRATTLDGLTFEGRNKKQIMPDNEVVKFYETIKWEQSEEAIETSESGPGWFIDTRPTPLQPSCNTINRISNVGGRVEVEPEFSDESKPSIKVESEFSPIEHSPMEEECSIENESASSLIEHGSVEKSSGIKIESTSSPVEQPTKRPRGRPRKVVQIESTSSIIEQPTKRPRGRPRKVVKTEPTPDSSDSNIKNSTSSPSSQTPSDITTPEVKRGRGRPRKAIASSPIIDVTDEPTPPTSPANSEIASPPAQKSHDRLIKPLPKRQSTLQDFFKKQRSAKSEPV